MMKREVFGSRADSQLARRLAALSKRTGAAGALVALSVLSAVAPQARAISDKEEAQMAQGMGPMLEERMGGALPASDPMAQRVERIGKRFAHLAHARSFGYRYRVLRNNTVLNAFAAPGGTIYITSRLVKFSRSEDELASIIGHETAHVSQRHIAQEVDERNAFVRFGARLAQLRREAAQGSRDKGSKKPAKAGKSAAKIDEQARAESSPWPTLTWYMLSRGRSRALESEADAVSVRWMKRLGYNPRASISLLQHADKSSPRSPSSPLGSLLASHPGIPERVVALRELIERENLDLAPKAKLAPKAAATPKAAPTSKAAPTEPLASGGVTSNGAPTTATSDVAAAAAAGTVPPAKPGDLPAAP